MEESSNKKPYTLGETSDEIDRISNLPDIILHYLLSFVETVDVVRLSVLSRRWKSLWKTIPYLNFDIHHFKGHGQVLRDKKFQKLIKRVLMNQGSTKITKFSLNCHDMFCNEKIVKWISVAVRRNVEELELKFDRYFNTIKLSKRLITCESLLVLKLYLPRCILQLPDNLNFKQLKSLYLEILISDEEFIPRLLSKCSLLQHLSIKFYIPGNLMGDKGNVKTLNISSSSLKCLTLSCEGRNHSYDLRISCPNLHSFSYKSELALSYKFDDVSSLNYLCLDMLDECTGFLLYHTIDILKQVQNIRVLELLGHFMRYPTDLQNLAQSFFPKLHGVKLLKLSNCIIDGWYTQGMFYLLDNFRNLESLSIVIEEDYECSELEDDWENTNKESLNDSDSDLELDDFGGYKVRAYWKNRLKSVSLINFKGIERELEFVKFILKNGRALEKLTINWSKEKKRTLTKNKQMLKFRRASSVAQVKIIC